MPMLTEHINAIAPQRQSDVLYAVCPLQNLTTNMATKSWVSYTWNGKRCRQVDPSVNRKGAKFPSHRLLKADSGPSCYA